MRLTQGRELPGHKGELLDGGGRISLFVDGHACVPHPT